MNRFYKLHIPIQWGVALVLLLLAGGICLKWIEQIQHNPWAVLLIFIVIPLSQFLLTPLLTLLGIYRYLSPMLLVYGATPKRYDLHNGTSFDYLLCFLEHRKPIRWRNQVLLHYIDGLLAIVQQIEEHAIPESIEIRGSSYFFSARTASKLGFETTRSGISENMNILLNCIDLTWMYSLSKGRLVVPKLHEIQTVSTRGATLKRKKEVLLQLKRVLENRNTSPSPALQA